MSGHSPATCRFFERMPTFCSSRRTARRAIGTRTSASGSQDLSVIRRVASWPGSRRGSPARDDRRLWDGQRKRRAAPQLTLNAHVTAVRFYDVPNDRETQPKTAGTRTIGLEFVEDLRDPVFGDAFARVGDP